MKKIITILGARPQFIKASVVSQELKKHSHLVKEIIVHTGQHFDNNMSKVFFDQMSIQEPKYFLNINSLNHGAMTGKMLEEIEKILMKENPEFVIVYGDTNSTLAGALVAKKLQIKIIHIEAGLRSHNEIMPEEINRIIVDRISDILFTPSVQAVNNLKLEGFNTFNKKIIFSGDVMYDTLLFYHKKMSKPISLDLNDKFILCTLHRAENVNDKNRFRKVIELIKSVAQNNKIVLPAHPRIKNMLPKIKNVIVIEPVGYLEMLWLLEHCLCVITDSGGLQKESYFSKKACLIIRSETEWTELVDLKVNHIVNTDKEKALNILKHIKQEKNDFNNNVYGNGDTSKIIVNKIIEEIMAME